MPAVYCMESCKDWESLQKQTTDRCMCEDQETMRQTREGMLSYMRRY